MLAFGYILIALGFVSLFLLLSTPLYGSNGKGSTQEEGVFINSSTILLTLVNVLFTIIGFCFLAISSKSRAGFAILAIATLVLFILLCFSGLTFKTIHFIKTNYKEQEWTTFQIATIINQQFTENFLYRLGIMWCWLSFIAVFFIGAVVITNDGKRYTGTSWLTVSAWIYFIGGFLLLLRIGHFFRVWVWHSLKRAKVIENIPSGQTKYKTWKTNHEVGFHSNEKGKAVPDGKENQVDTVLQKAKSDLASEQNVPTSSIEIKSERNAGKQHKDEK